MSETPGDDSLGGSHVKFQVDENEEDARSHRGQELRHFMMSGIKFERDNTEKLREFQMKGAYWWMQNFTKATLTWGDLPLALRLFCHGFWATLLPQAEADFDKAAELFQKSKEIPFDDLDKSQKEVLHVIALYLHEDHYAGMDLKGEAAEESLAAINITIPTVVKATFHD